MRRDKIVPFMRKLRSKHADASFDAAVLQARWQTDGQILQIVANMSATAAAFAAPSDWGEPIWGGPLPALLPAWSVYAAMKSR
jgi:hypothetical protein